MKYQSTLLPAMAMIALNNLGDLLAASPPASAPKEPEQSPEDAAEQLNRAERRRRARALRKSNRTKP